MALINWIQRHRPHRIWFPIVDTGGKINGKVSYGTAIPGDAYLHPLVRIVCLYRGQIYLRKTEREMLDYPFVRHLLFKENLDEAVRKTLSDKGENPDLPLRFVLRYLDEDANRLVYLYICNLNKKTVGQLHLADGKWWTHQQIEDNLHKGIFAPAFEQEYELLSHTVLMADQFIRDPNATPGDTARPADSAPAPSIPNQTATAQVG